MTACHRMPRLLLLVCSIGAALAIGLFAVNSAEPKDDAEKTYYLREGDVVLFLGDSITEETKYYWALFSDDLKQKYPSLNKGDVPYKKEEMVGAGIKFVNAGVSGDTAAGGVKRLEALLAKHKPTVCVVCFGMNDRYKDRMGYKKSLQEIVKKCKESKAAVTVLSPPCVDVISKPELKPFVKTLEEMTAEAKAVADDEGAIFADCYTPYRTRMEDRKNVLSYGDGIHPNDAGHRLMADALQKVWGYGLPLPKAGEARRTKAAKPSGSAAATPFHGGVVWEALTIAPEVKTCEFLWVHPRTKVVYAFCNKGDVYTSADEGKTWTLLTKDANAKPTGMAQQVLLDPKDENRLYVTTMYGGASPFVSNDGGKTWKGLGLGHNDFMAVDFSDPKRGLVLTNQHETPNGFRVNRKADADKPAKADWEAIDIKGVSSAAFMHVVDAKTWLLGGMAWGHGKSGVYRTEDAGKMFKLLGDASAAPPTHRCGFQEHKGKLLYLSAKGIVVSADQGKNWEVLPTPELPWSLEFTPDGAWLAGERGLHFSADDLKTWKPVATSHNVKDNFLAVHPGGKALFMTRYDGPMFRGSWSEKPAEFIVWSGDLPAGQSWAKLGPTGSFKVAPKAGLNESGRGLAIHMDGDGWRGCALNWKGWFPADACDDVSRYTALVFYVRQTTKADNADLTVTLADNVKRKEGESASNAVNVVGDGALDKIGPDWQRVVLPLNRFTHNKPLQLSKLWEIGFSNYGNTDLGFDIDKIGFAVEAVDPPRFKSGPSFQAKGHVAIDKELHAISDGIYGVCGLPRERLMEYRIPLTRWGGNPSSRYNWRLGVDSAGNDWFFKNRGKVLDRLGDTGYLSHIERNQVIGATTYQTVPMLGWVAKDGTSPSFSVAKYGAQKGTEPGNPDVGNGIRPDGSNVTGNDPRETSIPAPPEFVGDGVRFVVKRAGKADGSDGAPGVQYWALDNEPMIWHGTHRDVHPEPCGYDELWERTVKYGEAIKKADPTAKVAGFCSWGWTDLFYSAKDAGKDNYRTKADWNAHDKVALAEWFIIKCGEYKKKHGKPLVDVFDIHWYPQGRVKGQDAYLGRGLNPELNAYRLRSTRDLWDRKYEQEQGVSWIRGTDNYSPVALLPRVRAWIDKHNPGMEICLGEYNFGGSDNVSGGLAQADTFGILAREKLDLAFIWYAPAGSQESAWRLFRSYDGHKNGFGEQFLDCGSDNPDLSVYAARRKSDGAHTIAVVNKNLHGPCVLNLDLPGVKGAMRLWRFDQDTNEAVVEAKEQARAVDGTLGLTLPAASASMIVIVPEK